MPQPARDLVIHKGHRLSFSKLDAAIKQALSPDPPEAHTDVQLHALADIHAFPQHIAAPLDSQRPKNADPTYRKRLLNSNKIDLVLPTGAHQPDAPPIPIQLGQDLVSVACALSDDLDIDELDAAVFLFEARGRAAYRADHDVVAAAKELFVLKRSEEILFLQEIIRAGLYTPQNITPDATLSPFMTDLFSERDAILTQHSAFRNVLHHLQKALANLPTLLSSSPMYQSRLRELMLLAETVFLVAYTVQLTSQDANLLYTVLKLADEQSTVVANAAKTAGTRMSPSLYPRYATQSSKFSLAITYVDSIRNLLLLSWMTALDRSRYHNLYDPRTNQTGVNALLKDIPFIPSTNHLPEAKETGPDPVSSFSPTIAAAEVVGAVFRLAVANPDEEEANLSFIRLCAETDALNFLSSDLVDWVQNNMGSLCQDADLYADVLEDLALDIAEAPRLVDSLTRFDIFHINNAVTESAMDSMVNVSTYSVTPKQERIPALSSPKRPLPSGTPRAPWGKPPIPPSSNSRPSTVPSSVLALVPRLSEKMSPVKRDPFETQTENGKELPPNRTALLSTFIARAVDGAPSKLKNNSIGGGMRYWVGVGASSTGLIPKIGDAVIDLWDATNRNPNAPGGAGKSFREALVAFLFLLKNTSCIDSPSHAAAALKYLRHGGHPVLSLDRASKGISYMNDSFQTNADTAKIEVDLAEAEALKAVLEVISAVAAALQDQGGLLPILGDSGKELAIRAAVLAGHPVDPDLKYALICVVGALGYRRAISALLDDAGNDRSASLRRTMRNHEAPIGTYQVSLEIMKLVAETLSWKDDFPHTGINSIAEWFIIEEVLAFWSRRLYRSEEERWHIVATGADTLRLLLCRDPNSESSKRLISRLLTPAPGTGAVSFPLRALIWASGLFAQGDSSSATTNPSPVLPSSGATIAAGRAALTAAASHGDGMVYRRMQKALRASSRMLSLLLNVPPGRVGVSGAVIAPAYELLLTETEAISYASSLVFSPDGYDPEIQSAGYEPKACSAVLAMLARAAQCSPQIASILTRDPPGLVGSAIQFRASLARLLVLAKLSSATEESDESDGEGLLPDPPMIFSILKTLEACLGPDGGSAPGRFLLGFKLDGRGGPEELDFGVLGALLEIIVGSPDLPESFDKVRATAATFLDRLAADTVPVTSKGVLNHLKTITENDAHVRGSGFADEMLFRICEATLFQDQDPPIVIDWTALTELLAACLRLSALQIRMFPEYEKSVCKGSSVWGIEESSVNAVIPASLQESGRSAVLLPSPIYILGVLRQASISGAEKASIAEAFKAWYQMTGVRIETHEVGCGYASHVFLNELISELLNIMYRSGEDASGESLSTDAKEVTASSILHCTTKLIESIFSVDDTVRKQFVDIKFSHLVAATGQALISMSKAAARVSSSRTMLYSVLLMLYRLSRNLNCIELFGNALRVQSSARTVTIAEDLIEIGTEDAVSGGYAASQAASLSLLSVIVRCHPTSAVRSLASHNRLRGIVKTCFSGFLKQGTLGSGTVIHGMQTGTQKTGADGIEGSIEVAKACLALMHCIVLSEHGARVASDAGFVEAVCGLLEYVQENGLPQAKRGTGQDSGLTAGGDVGSTGKDVFLVSAACGAVAAAGNLGGSKTTMELIQLVNTNESLFLKLIAYVSVGNLEVLEAVSSIAMILSKVPSDTDISSAGVQIVRQTVATALAKVIPVVSAECETGDSGSGLSAGMKQIERRSSRERRRYEISHPGGGNLFERDVIVSRARCVLNCLSALHPQDSAIVRLILPKLSEEHRGRRMWFTGNEKGTGDTVSLGDVVHICRVLYDEVGRCAREVQRMEKLDVRDTATIFDEKQREQLLGYVCEEFEVQREQCSDVTVGDCIRRGADQTRRLMRVCCAALERALVLVRACASYAGNKMRQGDDGNMNNDGDGQMTVEDARNVMLEAQRVVVPWCSEVEKGDRDDWHGIVDSTLVKQLCRQLRAACAPPK